MSTTNYVLGFVFDPPGERVLLQLKRKPDWQRNRFNGIGGHIEQGETAASAMSREAEEEAGLGQLSWQPVCTLTGLGFTIFVFMSFTTSIGTISASKGGELLEVFSVKALPYSAIPNIRWLIPMALSLTRGEHAKSFIVDEIR